MENEEFIQMVHDNRTCHPGGEKMWLASEKQIKWFEDRIAKALDAETAAKDRCNELEFQRRSWHVITAACCIVFSVAFFFIGMAI